MLSIIYIMIKLGMIRNNESKLEKKYKKKMSEILISN
jgi:hypothetical protein